jgi:hypothetical protein
MKSSDYAYILLVEPGNGDCRNKEDVWKQTQQINTPVEMMRACPVGLMLAFAHGSILTLAS